MLEIEGGGGIPSIPPILGPISGENGLAVDPWILGGMGRNKLVAPGEKPSFVCFPTGPRKFKMPPGGPENPSARPLVGVDIGGLQLPVDSRGGVVPARRDEKLDETNFGKVVFWSISKDTKNGGWLGDRVWVLSKGARDSVGSGGSKIPSKEENSVSPT
jgi:hypothetical protein